MTKPRSSDPVPGKWRGLAGLTLLFFCSGTLGLVYEILWQRHFALVFGSAAPATTAVLAAFFGGVGLGSMILGRLAGKWRPLQMYAFLEALIGLGALLTAVLLNAFEAFYPRIFQHLSPH